MIIKILINNTLLFKNNNKIYLRNLILFKILMSIINLNFNQHKIIRLKEILLKVVRDKHQKIEIQLRVVIEKLMNLEILLKVIIEKLMNLKILLKVLIEKHMNLKILKKFKDILMKVINLLKNMIIKTQDKHNKVINQ